MVTSLLKDLWDKIKSNPNILEEKVEEIVESPAKLQKLLLLLLPQDVEDKVHENKILDSTRAGRKLSKREGHKCKSFGNSNVYIRI